MYTNDVIKQLGIENLDAEFFVNVEKRSVIARKAFEYEGKKIYTLKQAPQGTYNVDYENINSGKPTFDLTLVPEGRRLWKIELSNINYTSGKIDKWYVKYKLVDEVNWNETEDFNIFPNTTGIYSMKIYNGDIESDEKMITVPYWTSEASSILDNTNPTVGIVEKDENNNEWTWIEVPRTIFTTATSSTDYTNIENNMITYASVYRQSGYTDSYYTGNGTASQTEYNNLKNKMLSNIYTKGGFWISRYEIGTDTARTNASAALTTPLSQQNKYVYNYVIQSQAQTLANQMKPTNNQTTSLLFGIQWDLTMKYIETKGAKTQAELKTDSRNWGNYKDIAFSITRGKYSSNGGSTYTSVTGTYTKPISSDRLLTTGATERNSSLNIYDLAGNVYEWTMEKSANASYPCVQRSGYYFINGGTNPAGVRSYVGTTSGGGSSGFRVTLI